MLKGVLMVPLALASTLAAGGGESGKIIKPPRAVKNIILVHGAFADGSSYAKVIPILESNGFHVTAVQNPLSSLADDVAATMRAIALQDGPVILVGHSLAGVVITEAGNDPKVAGLVYISAIIPGDGESAVDVLKAYPPAPGVAQQKADARGYVSLTRQGVDEDFVPDLPAAQRAIVYATQGDVNSVFFNEKVKAAAWKTKPSWSIIVNDRMLPPELERATAKRINATTTTLTSSHVPMLSQPAAVAAVIMDAANKSASH